MEVKFSYYENKEAYKNSEVTLDNYIGFVQHGANQDVVIKARGLLQKGDKDGYKEVKNDN